MQSTHSLVLRDGKWEEIDSALLVPGDIVQIRQGNKVPADLRVLELLTINLMINQSMLTGETDAVKKQVKEVSSEVKEDAEMKSVIFSGTLVEIGSAKGVVIATGM